MARCRPTSLSRPHDLNGLPTLEPTRPVSHVEAANAAIAAALGNADDAEEANDDVME
jgi:hypothetical protein